MINEKSGKLVVISGPSGSGKGTVLKELFALTDNKYKYSVSATTRSPREGETDGVNYYFLSRGEFFKKTSDGDMLEYVEYSGNYYGTPKGYVREQIKKGLNVILEIDIQGAMKIKEKIPEGIFIYIIPPSFAELVERIKKRGTDSFSEIENRLKCFYEEAGHIKDYEYIVVNGEVESAARQIEAIITADKCLVRKNKALIEKILRE